MEMLFLAYAAVVVGMLAFSLAGLAAPAVLLSAVAAVLVYAGHKRQHTSRAQTRR